MVPATIPNTASTITLNAAYNVGTLDMSARTANTLTFSTGLNNFNLYGNWVNGTVTTLSGTGFIFFLSRSTQTITSAGRTFTQAFSLTNITGTVALQDALVINNGTSGITLNSGTFEAGIYNVTLDNAATMQAASGTATRTLGIGSGTWTITTRGVS